MKPFDLTAAINGAKLVTRDGRDVTEFHYFKTCTAEDEYPVGAVIDGKLLCFKKNGSFGTGMDRDNNLFLKSEKKKLWIAIDKERPDGNHNVSSCAVIDKEALRFSAYTDCQIVQVEIDV
jgi:hypothetical protein